MASQEWLEKDFYAMLGVPQDASKKDIERAYRKLARELHPDHNPEPAAEERFKGVSEAYSVLHDDKARAEYDQIQLMKTGRGGFGGMHGGGMPGGGSVNFEDLFANPGSSGGGSPTCSATCSPAAAAARTAAAAVPSAATTCAPTSRSTSPTR